MQSSLSNSLSTFLKLVPYGHWAGLLKVAAHNSRVFTWCMTSSNHLQCKQSLYQVTNQLPRYLSETGLKAYLFSIWILDINNSSLIFFSFLAAKEKKSTRSLLFWYQTKHEKPLKVSFLWITIGISRNCLGFFLLSILYFL